MEQERYDNYVHILKHELVPALGCTEPIAIAYAGAVARRVLGKMPERVKVACSGNIIKNVKAVYVPNSGGKKGVEVAAMLGIIGGDADKELAVLESVRDEHRAAVDTFLQSGNCAVSLIAGDDNLHIVMELFAGEESSLVEIKGTHQHIIRIEHNGEETFTQSEFARKSVDKSMLNLRDIVTFADEVRIEDIQEVIDRQIAFNCAISAEGLSNPYGAQIGRLLMGRDSGDVHVRAKAAAAAGSDARMNGCTMPVVINSGSGNQGITVSVPVVEYAKQLNCSQDKLRRALVLSNLAALLQKRNIGSLSAFCGAVCAAAGAGCGIAYLEDQPFDVIAMTISNTLAIVGGIVCDGAKASCAGKIAEALDAAILGYSMAKEGIAFQPGEGLVKSDVEDTILSVGRMGRIGMASTDIEILNIMLERN